MYGVGNIPVCLWSIFFLLSAPVSAGVFGDVSVLLILLLWAGCSVVLCGSILGETKGGAWG